MTGFVVDFTLPGDAGLFIHHGVNVTARNRREAARIFQERFPTATVRKVDQGMVCLYGLPYATWDATRGAEFALAEEQVA